MKGGFLFDTYVPQVQGRLTRRRFWASTLLLMVTVSFISLCQETLEWQVAMSERSWMLIEGCASALALGAAVAAWSLAVRRMHDVGRTGWWTLLMLLPGIGNIFYIVAGCVPGQKRDNVYGPNPYDTVEVPRTDLNEAEVMQPATEGTAAEPVVDQPVPLLEAPAPDTTEHTASAPVPVRGYTLEGAWHDTLASCLGVFAFDVRAEQDAPGGNALQERLAQCRRVTDLPEPLADAASQLRAGQSATVRVMLEAASFEVTIERLQ